MKDDFSYTPKELFGQVWNSLTLGIQAQQSVWTAILTLDGIIISAISIIATINPKINIFIIFTAITLAFISVILIIYNFRKIADVISLMHTVQLNANIDDDGHVEDDGQFENRTKFIDTSRNRIKLFENIAICFSIISVISIPVFILYR